MMIRVSINLDNECTKPQLIFVDLAGFEPMDTMDIKSSTFINGSLSALQSVLMSMVKKDEIFSYRNSSLTKILQKYLTIESKIVLLATVKLSLLSLRSDLNALRPVAALTGVRRK